MVGGIQDVLMSKFSLRYFSARIEKCALTAVVSLVGNRSLEEGIGKHRRD